MLDLQMPNTRSTIYPAQLVQLRRVFDDELMRRGWSRQGDRAENLASRIFYLYQSGTRSSHELHERLTEDES
ncbi:hypothetical protein CO661_31235 [Sinorhizobium fredii]|uniref:Uncharacterized protein n=1 Tax=Rhizobium fredii TaxID=380 RepID=A0A2A6LNZ2_RHIFR|nr:hypothetical protein CO661_31235 [Sinorhizobium fredii]